jgi:hypothetical protein
MELRCYLCDEILDTNAKPFKIGTKEELVCFECYTKTVNRKKAVGESK